MMPASTEARSGLFYGWALGESGWNTGMDANLLAIGRVAFHPSVKNRTTTTPPTTPAAGDSYIVGTGATGTWATKDGQVTVWDGTAWQFYAPRLGWKVYIEAEDYQATYNGGWSQRLLTKSLATDANYTASALEAMSDILSITSAVSLTVTRNIVLPLATNRQFTVYNGTTGAQALQFIGATGTGVTVANGKRAIIHSDGTNFNRVTADT